MGMTTLSTRRGFERALEVARSVGDDTPLPGLAAPLEGSVLGRVAEAWDAIDSALRDAYWRGIQAAQAAVDVAVARAEELVAAAGRKAEDVQAALLARLQTYLQTLVDEALAQVRDTITAGNRTLALTSVSLSQTIALSGSLKASIQEVASMTGTGELVVSAEYGA